MKKKIIVTLVATTLTMILLAGCGKSKIAKDVDSTSSNVTTEDTTTESSDDTESTKESKEDVKDNDYTEEKTDETTESTEATTAETTTEAASTQSSTQKSTSNDDNNKISGVHDVTVSVDTDYNTFIDKLIEGVSGVGEVVPITDKVDLSKPGKYKVTWTSDGKKEATCTVTVKK